MVFSSTIFLFFFLPITIIGYWLIKQNLRNYWLLFSSLVFFAWSQPNYLWIIILNILINYIAAITIKKFVRIKRTIVILAIILNLLVLFYFKYFDFVIESLNRIFDWHFELFNIVLPVGISFFTFQGLAYTIDVYRGDVKVQTNPFKVALYIMLFPQLIAGPIVRYKDIANEIDNRSINIDDFVYGIERFIIGLGKKTIIANTMAECTDSIWANGAGNIPCVTAWIGSIAYTLQILFDFSGYSDMAIGLGRMFGFHFNENFDFPYISRSITEFWRRWHISLSSWFRDYVYIPLGGNRKHVYRNLIIVFLLTGIWHGASWNFIIWGGYNGAFILVERYFKNKKNTIKREESIFAIVIKTIFTLSIVNIGWVIFRAPNLVDAIRYLGNMFGVIKPLRVNYSVSWYLDRWTIFCGLMGIFFSSSIPSGIVKKVRLLLPQKTISLIKYVLLIGIFVFASIRIVSGTYNPFIYFQF